jgi:hypothetical protein
MGSEIIPVLSERKSENTLERQAMGGSRIRRDERSEHKTLKEVNLLGS